MTVSAPRALLASALAAALGAASLPAMAQAADTAKVKEAVDIATDAYAYGYSLVTTDVTRIQMSNVAKAGPLNAPLNQFANVPHYPSADYRGVSAPNADTLSSLAWIDLLRLQIAS